MYLKEWTSFTRDKGYLQLEGKDSKGATIVVVGAMNVKLNFEAVTFEPFGIKEAYVCLRADRKKD